MDHAQAVEQKATERYLLDEMTPELREEFEEHLFDCSECTLDLRAASAFISEATRQLPELAPAAAPARVVATRASQAEPEKKSRDWFAWLRPAFAVPVFAALLLVIAYQNLSVIPSLQIAASEPRVLPWATLHAGTRSEGHTTISAQRGHGAVLLVDLPSQGPNAQYQLTLFDPKGKQIWTGTSSAEATGEVSLLIPGKDLEEGSYTLAVSNASPQAGSTEPKEIDRRVFDIHFDR